MTSSALNKDIVLIVSLVLSIVSVALFGVTWYVQQQDRELLFKLQEQINSQATIIQDDKMVNENEHQNVNQCDIASRTSLLKKGVDGVRYETIRSKRSNQRTKENASKREVVVYADNVETIQDNSNKGSVNDCNRDNLYIGGSVYVRWGHDECPSTAQLVYSGRAGGPNWDQPGGGSDPQCLPPDPSYPTPISGTESFRAVIYGAEYDTHTDSNSHVHGRHDTEVPCAVCHVSNRTAVYMVPAKYTCPTGWTREYYGYLMSSHYGGYRIQHTCMDNEIKSANGSSTANEDGLLFSFVEGRCGSLPCPPYNNAEELSCAVCTK